MLLLLLALLTGAFRVSAQDSELSPHALSTKLLFLDYAIPNGASLDTLGISNGVELAYIRNINNYLNLAFPAKIELANVSGYINKRTIVSADAVLQLQYYREDFWVVPYIFGGGGIASEEFDVNRVEFPMGVGANIRLGPNSYLNLQGEYRKSQSEDRDNLQYGIGYWFRLGPRDPNTIDQDNDGISDAADQCPTEAGPAATFGCPDTDLDGVADKVDECPDEAGPATTLGCPDTDGDGIVDSMDDCPTEAGEAELNGCPDNDQDDDGVPDPDDDCPTIAGLPYLAGCPDSDGDGIIDPEDDCPSEAGPADRNGCPLKDSDGDGIMDDDDMCPDDPGPALSGGCPDSDGDGILDKDDNCPEIPGQFKYGGCPDVDTDGDGVMDQVDLCPTDPGPYNGCPDTDGDGIDDSKDNCPNSAGPMSNNGCPEIKKEEKEFLEFAAQSVQFATGKATLKAESFAILDQVAEILLRYPDYKVRINGHTDAIGAANANQVLSEERARSCYEYLVSRSVPADRLQYKGYGESKPIATNDTEEGREENRRVEFELYIK